jgi:anti-sigma B factor antagonist
MLQIEYLDGVPVGRLPSDVDAANAIALGESLAASAARPTCDLVVDLTATRYIDSMGLDMLFRLNQRLDRRRATLRLVIPTDSPLMRLAQIVSLPTTLPIHAGVAEAVAACAADRSSQTPAGH